jgi:hypothetical protein
MGVTKADLDAQRAMLERGEEKRKAARQAEERERLRDTFAAAALTGLLSNVQRYQNGPLTEQAFEIAEFMLKEREKTSVGVAEMDSVAGRKPVATPRSCARSCSQPFDSAPTTHDAVPAPKCGGEAGLSSRNGTGNTPSKAEIDALEYVVEEGRTASIDDYGVLRSWLIRLRPEWESQSYEESNEKRVNTNTNRDTTRGEGSVRDEGTVGERLVQRVLITQTLLDDNETLRAEIARLRLTDAEREAVETADAYMSAAGCHNTNVQKTLRGLLERLR